MKKARKLKIHSKTRYRNWDQITVPEIRLEGKWLQDLGFTVGKQVLIDQKKNKLTIELLDGEREK